MNDSLEILTRMISPNAGLFSQELAKHFLAIEFTEKEKRRYLRLAAKCDDGKLTASERIELEHLVVLNNLLSLLKLKAKKTLHDQSHAA